MSENPPVPGLIVNELVKYYYEPHHRAIMTDNEDQTLYERMATFVMEPRHEKHYRMVVQELIATEASYVEGLQTMMTVYLDTLAASKYKKKVAALREEVGSLIKMHQLFFQDLNEAAQQNPECPHIGAVVKRFSPFLEISARYIYNYPAYLKLITELSADSSLQSAFAKAADQYTKNNNCYVQNIQQYLITPIQRPPRYVLLLTDMLRNIARTYADADVLIEAHKAIKKTASTINTKGYEYEMQEKYDMAFRMISNFKTIPDNNTRTFACCGPLFLVGDRNVYPDQWNYFFLFSDVLVETEITHLLSAARTPHRQRGKGQGKDQHDVRVARPPPDADGAPELRLCRPPLVRAHPPQHVRPRERHERRPEHPDADRRPQGRAAHRRDALVNHQRRDRRDVPCNQFLHHGAPLRLPVIHSLGGGSAAPSTLVRGVSPSNDAPSSSSRTNFDAASCPAGASSPPATTPSCSATETLCRSDEIRATSSAFVVRRSNSSRSMLRCRDCSKTHCCG